MLVAAGCVSAQNVSYTGNMQYATGSYFFDENTQSLSFSNGLSISGKKFTLSFSAPLILQSSPWVSYNATGYLPTGGPEHRGLRDSSGGGSGNNMGGFASTLADPNKPADATLQQHGGGGMRNKVDLPDTSSYNQASFGDPNVYGNFKLYTSATGATAFQLNAGVKIPLADPNSGYGTGEWDYGAGLSVSQRIGNYFLMADFMKWWFGDFTDLKLQDPIAYSLGIGRSLGGGSWLVNASYSGYTEIIDGYDPPQTLNLGIGYFVTPKVAVNTTLTAGLSESTADFMFGLGWMIGL